MTTLNLRNPNGYDGSPGTQYKQGIVRLATDAEVAAGTATNVVVTVAQLNSVSTGANFASPPILGFGSTTPRPVHATTLDSTGLTSLATGAGAVTNIGNATGTIGFFGATPVVKQLGTTDLRVALINLGLYTTGGASPLNLNGGAFNAATVTSAGNITATNGNLVLGSTGNKMIRTSVASTIAAGANSIGTVTLVAGTATISTTNITASSIIKTWRESIGSTGAVPLGFIVVGTRTPGVSFVINSVDQNNAENVEIGDLSVIGWEIIN